jgi:transcriptional regulator with XRE-family HTH domain
MRDLLAFGQSQRQQRPSPLLRTMVGGVLRRTRLSQRRTLADVAASARISMQYLSELERGRKEASSEILAALCRALRLDLSELLAAVGHDLLNQRDHRAGVVRIGAFRDDPAQPARPQLAPDLPAAPADGGLAGGDAAPGAVAGDLLARELLAGGQLADGDLSSPASGGTDLVCRLAA